MRWSVIACLVFVTLFGLGLRSAQPDLGVEMAHAQSPPAQTTKEDGQKIEWAESVVSDPHVSEAKALEDALVRAQARLKSWLEVKDPNLKWTPTTKFIHKNVFKKPATPSSRFSDSAQQDMTIVTMNLEVTADALKKIYQEDLNYRIEGRLWCLARIVGGLVLLLGALAGCIRLDEWTKGYLTKPLRLGALVLAVGGAAVLWFVV